MAKKTIKPAEKKVASPSKKTATVSKPKAPAALPIEKVCEGALQKLKSMKTELGLQAEIEWCLGSYRHDNNPSGLYEMAEKALTVLKAAAEKNPKAVSAKLLTDISKALTKK